MKQQALLLLLATSATTKPMWIFTGSSTPVSAPTAPSSNNSYTINSGNSFSKDNKVCGAGNINIAVPSTIPGVDEGRDGTNPERYDFEATGIAGYKPTPDDGKIIPSHAPTYTSAAKLNFNTAYVTTIKKSPKNSPRHSPRTLTSIPKGAELEGIFSKPLISKEELDKRHPKQDSPKQSTRKQIQYDDYDEERYWKSADDATRSAKETVSNIWTNVCDSYNKTFNNPKK